MIRLLLALVVLASATGSVSATPVRGQCEGTRCEEFEIVERKVVREGGDGTLIWTRLLGWTRDGFQGSVRKAAMSSAQLFGRP